MAKPKEIPAGPELDALVAAKVMGWKRVRRDNGKADVYRGKKPDKLGRWRSADVRPYSTNPADSYLIDKRMAKLGLAAKYSKELARITHGRNMPVEWASPEQRCRAALKTVKQ